MAFKRIVRDKAFWKSVIIMGLAFAIIYQFISMLFDYGGLDFSAFYEDKLAGAQWVKFVIGTLVAAFLYGFIITYGQFVSRIKKEKRERQN
ncbi:hypothetical protein FK178_09260 [Antarcticibacterium arcticum]|uniref:Uncharacterized protein n=1 Tax=Antarcticibacterium arcticum TaxID=2585771 RepID=A0A5B8YIY1_9FLAO|nr:hypothetical protein [Antarcticibacterium arcticum]QED37900.1 hypothetical protein FK178_09260 [Antarcticibacterium arcticum]